jgi:hypothetical protein
LEVEVPHTVDGALAAAVEIGVDGEPDPAAEARLTAMQRMR